MKKFLIKVFVFVLIIAVLTVALNYVYMKRDKSDLDYTRKYDSMPEKIVLCNFGSSHGQYDFNYEGMEDRCFNFALPSQMPSYDLRLFEYYKDRFSNGAVAFIPVSYFSIFGTTESEDDGFLKKNKRYYRILPASAIKEYDIKTDLYVRYLPSITAGEDFFITVFTDTSTPVDSRWYTKASDKDITDDTYTMFSRQIVNYVYDKNGEIIVNDEEIGAIKELISLCRENNVRPILVTTPYLHDYTDIIRENYPDFFERFDAKVNEIVQETGVEYYNYAFDDRFINSRDWFFNCDHLNNTGAKVFVATLLSDTGISVS
ncbi:hypothetical protein SAMN02910456_02425 [Ruminococcaceae bacterium YRB3002]|nr:hypothetical protein SAMN02910456_02425 [Ruminococcaceae bacterium YRB3002]